MKILVILGHPEPGSFNHAVADTAVEALKKNGHEVIYHDLQTEGFDPVLLGEEIARDGSLDPNVQLHCEELMQADGIVIIHPNWWGQPPAVLKGWIDRVFRPGVAYEFEEEDSGEGVPLGLLKAEAVVIFNTSNTPEERELSVFGDPLENLWKTCIFDLCGVKNFHRQNFGVIVTSSPEQRQQWLEQVAVMVGKIFSGEA
jgi:putative NADPH-quinone reductase